VSNTGLLAQAGEATTNKSKRIDVSRNLIFPFPIAVKAQFGKHLAQTRLKHNVTTAYIGNTNQGHEKSICRIAAVSAKWIDEGRRAISDGFLDGFKRS